MTRRRGSRAPGEPRLVAYAYVAPALLVFGLFLLAPLAYAVQLSFFEWDGLGLGTWVGLDNYVAVLTDPELRAPFLHALVLVVFFSLVPVTLGLVLAALMTRSRVRGAGFFRTVIFLPQVVALTVVAVVWRQIYAPTGPLNDALRLVGLDGFARGWLGDADWVLVAIGLVGTWVGTGLCTVLFLAGLAKVGRELYEAARLDGAGFWTELRSISLPAVRGELAVALTLTMVAALRTFDLVYVMTAGGPGNASRVPSYEVYDRAIQEGDVGTGITVALVLTALILLATWLVNRIAGDGEPA
ncbi:sugar ABC transporter permease [Nocardioides sp. HDW12B]|uniref:carbohydrate ABC transporter permease n=1 Tax=Nocardioides sp. HDW12B TaxID=2714939 RepID=UPI0014076050|nr:sugar ABC transporter permease [Nocardioides sp. HDW12B]QIK68172.1 sugar ABC transporter permease [Nocardioides sp. HDW12B]